MNFVMHNFTSEADPNFPPSLSAIFTGLGSNNFLIRGILNTIMPMTAQVYNPGTSAPEAYYDAYNVAVNDWLASDTSGYSWIIQTLYAVTDAPDPTHNTGALVFYATIEDQYAYNAGCDPIRTAYGGPQFPDTRVVQFTVDENGIPIFRPTDTFTMSANFSGNILGRFMTVNNYTRQVRIYQTAAASTFNVGDPIFINTSTNQFQRSNTLGDVPAIYTTIGIVSTVGIPSANYFTFKPFGQFRPSSQVSLTGPVGTTYYIDPTNTTQYTTSEPANNPFPVYQIIDPSGNAIQLTASGKGGGGGPTGPTGAAIYTSIIFDGGDSTTNLFPAGPAFDCGSSI